MRSILWLYFWVYPKQLTYASLSIIVTCAFFTGLKDIAAEQQFKDHTDTKTIIGFVDQDRNGINDLFYDANGDGINDVTGKSYPHSYRFIDQDDNGINDLFIDQDGDGINDIKTSFIDMDKDGIENYLIDMDRDGVNDITGLPYTKHTLEEFREKNKRMYNYFIDRNDSRSLGKDRMQDPMDRFIDEDGDGIADRRTLHGRSKRKPPHILGAMRERLEKKQGLDKKNPWPADPIREIIEGMERRGASREDIKNVLERYKAEIGNERKPPGERKPPPNERRPPPNERKPPPDERKPPPDERRPPPGERRPPG